jgi:hypothetical protein
MKRREWLDWLAHSDTWPLWWCYWRSQHPDYAIRAFENLRERGVKLTPKEQDALLEVLKRATQPRNGKRGPASKRLLERDFEILSQVTWLLDYQTTPPKGEQLTEEKVCAMSDAEKHKLAEELRIKRWGKKFKRGEAFAIVVARHPGLTADNVKRIYYEEKAFWEEMEDKRPALEKALSGKKS